MTKFSQKRLSTKLARLSKAISGKGTPLTIPKLVSMLGDYQELSKKQTTDVVKRERHPRLCIDLIEAR